MNRNDFNNLSLYNQVNYFNEQLKENNFNAICKDLGVSKNTILKKFNSNGYQPVRKGQKIIIFEKVDIIEQTENSTRKNLTTENSVIKNKTEANDPKVLDLILNRIELLEQKVEVLESNKNNLVDDFINTYDLTTTKTFKIDVGIYKELEELFNKYKMYKRQDIVSSLLRVALDNIE